MTAPTSKSKTKNYRLLTVGAQRPHMLAAAYFQDSLRHYQLWSRDQPMWALRPDG